MTGQFYNTLLNYSSIDLDNTSTNTSEEKPEVNRAVYNLYDTFLVITGIITIMVNGVVFFLFTRKHYLKTATNYILLSLAASDMLAGILVVPLYVTCVVSFLPMVCISFDMSQRVVAISNIYHLAAVTAERYITIIYPLRSPRLMTKKRIGFAICAIWFASLVISLIQIAWIQSCPLDLTSENVCSRPYELVYDIVCVVVIFFLPLLTMLYADIRMLLVVIKQSKMINKQQVPSTAQKSKPTHHYRAVVTFTVMLGSFTICWCCFFLIPPLRLIGVDVPDMLDHIQFFLRFCSPFINPIIYIFFKHDFKRAFVGIIWQRLGWNSSSGGFTENRGSTSIMMRRRGP